MKNDFASTEKIFKSLANRRRIAIVKFLKGRTEASVSDIASEIKLSFKATSKHLAILHAVNILDREQKNINMLYRLSSSIPTSRIARALISVL
jgi:DNA-binding transcriptional ArsR family regulator